MNLLKQAVLILMLSLVIVTPVSALNGSGNSVPSFEDGLDDQNPADSFQPADDISIFGLLVQVVLALFFVGALIFLLVKFLSVKNRFISFNQPIKVVGTLSLTPQKSVRVVELGNSLYFLGVGEDVTLLQKIDDQDEIELIKATMDNGSSTNNFSHVLKTKMSEMMSKRQNIEQYLEDREARDRNEGKDL